MMLLLYAANQNEHKEENCNNILRMHCGLFAGSIPDVPFAVIFVIEKQ